jgi:hypothetical protein
MLCMPVSKMGAYRIEGRLLHLVCPVCEHELTRSGDWCVACGAYLGLLKRHPRRIIHCICASIALGFALFFALAWQVFAPLLRGWPPSGPGPWFWWGFWLGAFFLALGLTARQHLSNAFRRMLQTSNR